MGAGGGERGGVLSEYDTRTGWKGLKRPVALIVVPLFLYFILLFGATYVGGGARSRDYTSFFDSLQKGIFYLFIHLYFCFTSARVQLRC